MLEDQFTHFTNSNPDRLHFAAHSHHPWPDVSLEAQKQYWMDTAQWLDQKWGKTVFSTIIPSLQKSLARELSLSKPQNIAFAPNTHEFVLRLLSCLPQDRIPRILTTDSEFYSFDRQIKRMLEAKQVEVNFVPAEPFDSFTERFTSEIRKESYDLVFFSQTFFNSGFTVRAYKDIVRAVQNPSTMIVIDGYHGFMALPTDLSDIEERAFYLSGGYKYAMSGEGSCFIHVPDGYAKRPINTGWFADIGALEEEKGEKVPFADDGYRFWGATFDPSGLYRMNSVMNTLHTKNCGTEKRLAHVRTMQKIFIEKIDALNHPEINTRNLMIKDENERGHFLTFRTALANSLKSLLESHNIITDSRADRLRFGFGIYHSEDMIERLITRMNDIFNSNKSLSKSA